MNSDNNDTSLWTSEVTSPSSNHRRANGNPPIPPILREQARPDRLVRPALPREVLPDARGLSCNEQEQRIRDERQGRRGFDVRKKLVLDALDIVQNVLIIHLIDYSFVFSCFPGPRHEVDLLVLPGPKILRIEIPKLGGDNYPSRKVPDLYEPFLCIPMLVRTWRSIAGVCNDKTGGELESLSMDRSKYDWKHGITRLFGAERMDYAGPQRVEEREKSVETRCVFWNEETELIEQEPWVWNYPEIARFTIQGWEDVVCDHIMDFFAITDYTTFVTGVLVHWHPLVFARALTTGVQRLEHARMLRDVQLYRKANALVGGANVEEWFVEPRRKQFKTLCGEIGSYHAYPGIYRTMRTPSFAAIVRMNIIPWWFYDPYVTLSLVGNEFRLLGGNSLNIPNIIQNDHPIHKLEVVRDTDGNPERTRNGRILFMSPGQQLVRNKLLQAREADGMIAPWSDDAGYIISNKELDEIKRKPEIMRDGVPRRGLARTNDGKFYGGEASR